MSLGAPDFTPRRAARGNPDRKDRPMPKMPEIREQLDRETAAAKPTESSLAVAQLLLEVFKDVPEANIWVRGLGRIKGERRTPS